ncbi:MAG TPA: tetratricopeptide repeat protein [Thiolinea sp.]|mgnify:FL=1|nr:tetratricopeptide repeat protein [Thiolinea sp.]
MLNSEYTDADAGLASGMAAFEAKHFARAMQLLYPYAEQGDAQAQYYVAIMYQNGLGNAQSDVAAWKWMQDSANQGYGLAQHGLGFMYLEGECVDHDSSKAAEWFQKAADQGLPGSLLALAGLYEKGDGVIQNPEVAQRLYKLAGF